MPLPPALEGKWVITARVSQNLFFLLHCMHALIALLRGSGACRGAAMQLEQHM